MADGSRSRMIKLRYAGVCTKCGTELAAKAAASWDKDDRRVSCLRCAESSSLGIESTIAQHGHEAHQEPPALSASAAGGSAQAEHDRRHRKRDERLDAKWGRLAGVARFLSDDPQSTKAWARGAEGERRLAGHLARALGDRAVFLHDRKHGRANIDHVVIATSGVWVVDAKNYSGRVEYRNVAGWFGPADNRIYVGGRDKTKLAAGLEWQVAAVRTRSAAWMRRSIQPCASRRRTGVGLPSLSATTVSSWLGLRSWQR